MSALVIADVLENVPARCHGAVAGAAAEFALVTARDAFDALEAEWTGLFDRCATSSQLFQSHAWLWHWTRHFLAPPDVSLAIVTARRNGRLVLVWPLARRCGAGGLSRLDWMGEPVSQYGDVLVEPGADALPLMRDAWTFLRTRLPADLVNLRKTRADAAVAPLLAEIGARASCRDSAPFADLSTPGGFTAYADARWSAKTRKNRRRQMRRLEEIGPVAVQRLTSGAEAARLASHAIKTKRAWLGDRGLVSPALANPAYESFFAAVAAGGEHPAGCRVSQLAVNGEPAALEIAIRCRERLAVHIIAYEPAFERGGAGAALMEDAIRQAFADGVTCFDLLGPGGGYKDEWSDGAVEMADWTLALSLKGRLYARGWLTMLRPRLKAIANGMPKPLRKLLTGTAAATP